MFQTLRRTENLIMVDTAPAVATPKDELSHLYAKLAHAQNLIAENLKQYGALRDYEQSIKKALDDLLQHQSDPLVTNES